MMGVPDHQSFDVHPGKAAIEQDTTAKRKRKQPRTYSPGYDDSVQSLGEVKKSGFAKGQDDLEELQPKKKAKKPKGDQDEEKRLRQHRKKPTQSYLEIKSRALTQRMFVLDRARGGTAEAPEEILQIAGTTGNVYTVKIRQVPSCNCPHAGKGHQCKHIIYVMLRVLKAREDIAYQLALLSSELREVFEHAPAIPSADSSDSTDGNRKAVEGECPICCIEFEPDKEEIVWCKTSCGNNIHKACFDQWAAAKRASGKVTCPFCRIQWPDNDVSFRNIATGGEVNEDGYVNIAGQLGISGERDYSTYHSFWVNRQIREGNIERHHRRDYY